MSVDSAENTIGWGSNSQSTSTYENNVSTNQWLVNHTSMNSEKVCASWAQAVSGDIRTGDTSTSNSNIPNESSVKLNASNQNELLIADDNGSQSDNQTLMSSHFSFDELVNNGKLDPNDLYSTNSTWGKSVINHDNAWDKADLNPSSANDQNSNLATASGSQAGFKSAIDQQMRNINSNNGTEVWVNNLRQTKELQVGLDLQSSSNQQQIDQQQNLMDTQSSSSWSKMVQPNQSTVGAVQVSHCFGGTWGDEEDMTNVWTGIPNSSNNNLTNQQTSQQLNANSTSSSNVFNNRQPNSINDKANLQLMSNTNSNKNWISSDDNWGESIKTGNEWEQTSDIGMNANSVLTPKAQQEATENWSLYQNNKLNSNHVPSSQQAASNWSNNEIENKPILNDSDIDNGTSLWGNPQGQNKVLIWKGEENKQCNNQAIISNVEQWKKYSLNGNQINNGNWNELMENSVPGTSNLVAWNENSTGESDWAKNKRKLTKEIIASSSPFRILVEMGFKEEDVENSLRNTNLNLQESIEELRLNTLKETGVEIDRRKQQAQNSPIQGLPSINNILQRNNATPAKLPNQQSANLPSEKLLSHLVQQIQLAVQAGHLNAQILNQQLAPTTITLIYQLLQQIKLMQNLQSSTSKNYFLNFQVNQCKERIARLQKQINVQQALLFKQQQMHQTGLTGNRPQQTGNNNNNNNPMLNNLTNDLSNLQLNQQQNQSRLNQWKLPSNYDKDELGYETMTPNTPNDFSRAPGPSSSKQQQFISSPNSWSMPSGSDDSWQNKNQLSSSAPQQQQSQLMNPNNNYGEMDIANKQIWRKNLQQMNNPQQAFLAGGSGGNSDVKDQMYNWSATKLVDSNDNLANSSNTFNSSTWTFSNSTNAQLAAATTGGQNANIWTNNQSANTANNNKPTKGPPPGLGGQIAQKDSNQISCFLLIRNLTLQIDESILKTLCRQHGSLMFFHMFLNHGLAIVKYSSKEEAMKAQSALNNCSLGNTTIQVQVASESEVQQYLANFQAVNTPTSAPPTTSIYNNNDYMMNNNGAWNNGAAAQLQPNTSSNMWSFNQNQQNNLWIDQNSNNALQNLLPDNLSNLLSDSLLEST